MDFLLLQDIFLSINSICIWLIVFLKKQSIKSIFGWLFFSKNTNVVSSQFGNLVFGCFWRRSYEFNSLFIFHFILPVLSCKWKTCTENHATKVKIRIPSLEIDCWKCARYKIFIFLYPHYQYIYRISLKKSPGTLTKLHCQKFST